jgi:ferredoxin-thioredoxin reductase catalytic subunit
MTESISNFDDLVEKEIEETGVTLSDQRELRNEIIDKLIENGSLHSLRN